MFKKIQQRLESIDNNINHLIQENKVLRATILELVNGLNQSLPSNNTVYILVNESSDRIKAGYYFVNNKKDFMNVSSYRIDIHKASMLVLLMALELFSIVVCAPPLIIVTNSLTIENIFNRTDTHHEYDEIKQLIYSLAQGLDVRVERLTSKHKETRAFSLLDQELQTIK